MVSKFYKNMLSPKLHKTYDDAVRNFSAMKFEVDVQAQGIVPQDLVSVYNAVLEDCPELFYITQRPNVGQKMGFFGSSFKIVSSSIFSPSQVGNYKIKLDKIAKDFKNKTANLKTVEEKVQCVCDFFIENVKYEINNEYNQNCATALINHKGQCSGISKGVKFILDYLGIDCISVEGEAWANGQGGPHAWNIVWVNGQPYHLDVTNMIGANASKTKPYFYLYFLGSEEEMEIHTWDKSKYPRCDKKCPYKSFNAQNGTSNGYNQAYAKKPPIPSYDGKIVKFSIEMEKEIEKAIENKERTLSFSTALSVEGQELLDEVCKTVKKVGKKQGVGLSFSVKIISGFNVEITFTW